MDYQITCVCGNRFLVPEQRIGSTVICPACHQKLSPVVERSAPPARGQASGILGLPGETMTQNFGGSAAPQDAPVAGSGAAVAAGAEPTKRCPYCGEVILAIARKCKHCGEFLDRADASAAAPSTAFAAAPGTASGSTWGAAPSGSAHDPSAQNDIPPVFEMTISQWDNFWKFLILLTLVAGISAALILIKPLKEYAAVGIPGAIVFAFFICWYFYLAAKSTRYFIRPLRIDVESGVISKEINSLELFRISDMELKQGLTQRILGIGSIRMMTSDPSLPELILFQVPRVREVYKYIQNQIPISAKQRGAVYMEK